MKVQQAGCRVEIIFAIRDARGLSEHEKMFLVIVESRGVMTTAASRAMEDMSMSRATFYRTRDSLVDRGLLTATTRGGATTKYRVNAEALKVSHTDNSDSPETVSLGAHPPAPTGTGVSHRDNKGVSHRAPEEVLRRGTKEEKQEETPAAPLRPLRASATQPARITQEMFRELMERADAAGIHITVGERPLTGSSVEYFSLANSKLLTTVYDQLTSELASS